MNNNELDIVVSETSKIAGHIEELKPEKYILEARDVNVYYGGFQALKNINLGIHENKITALIGPSGCGKSTFLRLFNRMNDYIEDFWTDGQVLYNNQDVYAREVKTEVLRKEI